MAERRWDPLRGSWVLVSPGRNDRPWQGSVESAPAATRPEYDPDCYLCPGNVRANGERNPAYESTFAFTNDFSALDAEPPDATSTELLRAEPASGECRVICFSPRHDLDLGSMPAEDIRRVVDLWAEESAELGKRWRWVQVFENRGEQMGASNPHPHGQIWASDFLPDLPAGEDVNQRDYFSRTGRPMLADIADEEANGPRVVQLSEHWLAIVPYWATWPFETLVIARDPVARLPDMDQTQRNDLAAVLNSLVGRYDRVFDTPFPYSMGWHGAPFEPDADTDAWRLHAHIYPPLLRSATVRKFMVGYELLAQPQRDLLPEEAAERLRSLS